MLECWGKFSGRKRWILVPRETIRQCRAVTGSVGPPTVRSEGGALAWTFAAQPSASVEAVWKPCLQIGFHRFSSHDGRNPGTAFEVDCNEFIGASHEVLFCRLETW